jgi:hypothetical protein
VSRRSKHPLLAVSTIVSSFISVIVKGAIHSQNRYLKIELTVNVKHQIVFDPARSCINFVHFYHNSKQRFAKCRL